MFNILRKASTLILFIDLKQHYVTDTFLFVQKVFIVFIIFTVLPN